MPEQLLELVLMLLRLRRELGETAFLRALHRSRHGAAMIALETAEKRARNSSGKRASTRDKRSIH